MTGPRGILRALSVLAVLVALLVSGLAQGATPARQADSHAEGRYLLVAGVLATAAKDKAPVSPSGDQDPAPQGAGAWVPQRVAGVDPVAPSSQVRQGAARSRPAARGPPARTD